MSKGAKIAAISTGTVAIAGVATTAIAYARGKKKIDNKELKNIENSAIKPSKALTPFNIIDIIIFINNSIICYLICFSILFFICRVLQHDLA